MKKGMKNMIRGGVLALVAVVFGAVPVLAAACEPGKDYDGVMIAGAGVTTSPNTDYTVKCGAKIKIGETMHTMWGKSSADCSKAASMATNPDGCDSKELTGVIRDGITAVIFIVGIIAVIMVVLGGIQYTTSQGDAGKVKKAKDTIMYGIIGLVVAILAFAIVNFVLGSIF